MVCLRVVLDDFMACLRGGLGRFYGLFKGLFGTVLWLI